MDSYLYLILKEFCVKAPFCVRMPKLRETLFLMDGHE